MYTWEITNLQIILTIAPVINNAASLPDAKIAPLVPKSKWSVKG